MGKVFELYRRAAGYSPSGGGDEPAGEALSPDYTGNLLLNITTGDGTVLPQVALTHNGVRWTTNGDAVCYCGTECCPFVFLEYNNGWCTYCFAAEEAGGEEAGCWIGKGDNLALGANLIDTWTWTSGMESSMKPLSVVITKAS